MRDYVLSLVCDCLDGMSVCVRVYNFFLFFDDVKAMFKLYEYKYIKIMSLCVRN